MKYDDASWHNGGDFPSDSPPEWGGVHMGVFVRLMFLHGMAGELHLNEASDDVGKVLSGEWTGTEFLFAAMDGKMTDEDFSESGNKFARHYYSDGLGNFGQFLVDVQEVGELDFYQMPEDEVNMEAMDDIFTVRLANFEATGDVMREAQ